MKRSAIIFITLIYLIGCSNTKPEQHDEKYQFVVFKKVETGEYFCFEMELDAKDIPFFEGLEEEVEYRRVMSVSEDKFYCNIFE